MKKACIFLITILCTSILCAQKNTSDTTIYTISDDPLILKHISEAEKHFTQKEYVKAAKQYIKAYNTDTSVTELLYKTAASYNRAKKTDHAIAYYKQSIQAQTNIIPSLEELSLIYIQTQAYDTAIMNCKTLLSKDEDNPHAYYNLAIAYTHLKQYEKAIHYGDIAFEEWFDRDMNIAQKSVLLVCKSFIALHNKEAAGSYYQKAIQAGMHKSKQFTDLGL
ncbi:MAG: tetratricopeptide repeat protein [Bacteroidales bacterium]